MVRQQSYVTVLPVVPVQVKAAKGSQVLQVYALLDLGSTATFCSEALMSQLNRKGKNTHIQLSIMNKKQLVPTPCGIGNRSFGTGQRQLLTSS